MEEVMNEQLPVAIIGAGPIGLAAAAHLTERGIPFVVFERGDTAAASVREWAHVRLFSPFSTLIDPAARRLLQASGWREPADLASSPSGAHLVAAYLEPLARLASIAPHIRTGATVLAVSRLGMDRSRSTRRDETPFVVRFATAHGVEELTASAVIDASGTFSTPNSIGSSGLDPIGIDSVRDLVSGALPDVLGTDRERFIGKRVAVVGAGHSAANTLIALALLATESQADPGPSTHISWLIRNDRAVRVFTAESDELADRANLGARLQRFIDAGVISVVERFEIARLEGVGGAVRAIATGSSAATPRNVEADVIVNATGFRPDLSISREIRLDLDDIVEAPRRLAPLIDPNEHSCGTVEPHGIAELRHPESRYFVVGMKSYGRAPTFLLATGYEQVRSVVAHLAGDNEAASRIELVLPATGVCSTSPASNNLLAQTSCCSEPALTSSSSVPA